MTHSKTIAIVDDDEGVRTSLTSLLRSFGYNVRAYPSAIDFLAHVEDRPLDCIITDIQMPEMRGDELQAELIGNGSTVPMIFMTAFPTEAVRNRVMDAGARAILDKPTETALLVHHIEAALA